METDDVDDPSTDTEASDEPQVPVLVRNVLARVEDEARERPLVTIAAATGIGYVIGRGLPRAGLLALLGIGGLVGFAAMTLRRRLVDGDDDESTSDDDSADSSDDAHDISVSSAMPDADRPKRKPKKPNVVGGA